MKLARFIKSRIRDRSGGWCAEPGVLAAGRRGRIGSRRPGGIGEPFGAVDEHDRSGSGQTAAAATGGHKHAEREEAGGTQTGAAGQDENVGGHEGRTKVIEAVRRVALNARKCKKWVKF